MFSHNAFLQSLSECNFYKIEIIKFFLYSRVEKVTPENKMYKTVCSYQSVNDGVLSFPAGKVFNLIEQLDEHWWSMQDEFGNSGLIPATYLEVNKVKSFFFFKEQVSSW